MIPAIIASAKVGLKVNPTLTLKNKLVVYPFLLVCSILFFFGGCII